MTIPLFCKLTLEMKRKKRNEINKRYRLKYREVLLPKKREYARTPESLERRRRLYLHIDHAKPKPPFPIVLTLDTWATNTKAM